jgi:hypothetical protein
MAFCDLSKYTTHNLARAGFGQTRNDHKPVGRGDGRNDVANLGFELVDEFSTWRIPILQIHKRNDTLALDIVRDGDNCGFGTAVVPDESAFNLCRP